MSFCIPQLQWNSGLLCRFLSSKPLAHSEIVFRIEIFGNFQKSCPYLRNYNLYFKKKKDNILCNSDNYRLLSTTIHSSPFQDSRIPLHSNRNQNRNQIPTQNQNQSSQIQNQKPYPDPSTYEDSDTIAAIITPLSQSEGSVSIIRLSGKSAPSIALQLFKSSNPKKQEKIEKQTFEFKSHHVEYGFVHDMDGSLLDEVLLIPMLSPHSYTKENVIELQCHGGLISVQRILNSCLNAGARMAKRGEFTYRAFLNGRLDLNQAENISNLISSKTVRSHDSAIAGMQGGLSSLVKQLNEECINILTELEARIDFDDELPPLNEDDLIKKMNSMLCDVEDALKSYERGRYLQSGLEIAILGKPNVGKSSLLNAWSKSDKAIVTDVAGTTRDIIESQISINGYPVVLLDTAGIHSTSDTVESIGVARSEKAGKNADVILLVISANEGWTAGDDEIVLRIFENNRAESDEEKDKVSSPPAILVINKIDLDGSDCIRMPDHVSSIFRHHVRTCAITGKGIAELEHAILNLIGADNVLPEGHKWTVNKRQAEQLIRAKEAFIRVRESITNEFPIDFWCIDLKEAAMALGEVRGEGVSEQVLSEIFSRFCIGK